MIERICKTVELTGDEVAQLLRKAINAPDDAHVMDDDDSQFLRGVSITWEVSASTKSEATK